MSLTKSAVETSLDLAGSFIEPGTIVQISLPLGRNYLSFQPQIRLAYDILEIIIAQVFLDHRDDLFKICRASKQLYFACIPWIYRRITIDFSSPVGTTFLLQRLARVSSELPVFVREVVLKKCSPARKGGQEWILFDKCLSRFTNLSHLSCDDASSLPDFVLNTIRNFHPRAMIQTGIPWTSTIELKNPPHNFFNSAVLSQLTTFDFLASGDAFLYTTFKHDLVQLLTKASSLSHLCIYQGPVQRTTFTVFPEMISVFQAHRLPRLVSLFIVTRSIIFRRNELEAWGARKGWSKLRQLRLYRAHDLVPFLSRVRRLVYLSIATPEGMEELEQHLQEHKKAPLGMVRTLNWNHFIANPHDTVHIMPWAILKTISTTLTQYISWHQPLNVFDPGYTPPTTAQLLRFLKECPQVTHLELDIRVVGEMWPGHILGQLATFHNVQELSLYVHEPRERFQALTQGAPRLDFKEAFKLLTTTQSGSVTNPQLRVNFTEVRDFNNKKINMYASDWMFWTNSAGTVFASQGRPEQEKRPMQEWRREISGWGVSQLQDWMKHFGYQHSQDCFQPDPEDKGLCGRYWAIKYELQRRERDAVLERLYGDKSCTLYDMWIDVGGKLGEFVP